MQGILFKPWKQKAIRESPLDRPWQTRRLDHFKEINQEPSSWNFCGNAVRIIPPVKVGHSLFQHADGHCISVRPRYRTGETVYIKEAWAIGSHSIDYPNKLEVLYKTTHDDNNDRQWVEVTFDTWVKYAYKNKWRSPMFMPSWAARDSIKITDVRPERLRDITLEDAYDEGIDTIPAYDRIDAFKLLWDSINGKTYPFDGNYWVWRICFNLIKDKR